MNREPVYLHEIVRPEIFKTEREDQINKLMAIIESLTHGIYITDGKGKTIMINRSYEIISGLKSEEVIGKYMQEMEEEGIVSRSASLMAINRCETVTIEQELKTEKVVIVTSTPIFDENDNIVIVVSNVRDASEYHTLKEQFALNFELNRDNQSEIRVIHELGIENECFIARDKKMIELMQIANRVAKLDTTVLLLGETGVGKECVATYIHNNSLRCTENFIKINCAAIASGLVESELFGYESGSFTGANKTGKIGFFEAADKGTIFLDEISELPYHMQAKLLRVLQEQEILRVGSEKSIKVNVRILASSNRSLEEMVKEKKFREDLYYRLNVFPISIPPLRERKGDIIVLAQHMLNNLNKKYGTDKIFSQTALDRLLEYRWPGNVRELKNLVERAFIMSGDRPIIEVNLPIHGTKEIMEMMLCECERFDLKEMLERIEKTYIIRAYEKYKNVRDAAKSLEMDPSTYTRKRKKYLSQYTE